MFSNETGHCKSDSEAAAERQGVLDGGCHDSKLIKNLGGTGNGSMLKCVKFRPWMTKNSF